jgi:hypothetical protein
MDVNGECRPSPVVGKENRPFAPAESATRHDQGRRFREVTRIHSFLFLLTTKLVGYILQPHEIETQSHLWRTAPMSGVGNARQAEGESVTRPSPDAATTLRRICLVLFVAGAGATGVELMLVEHHADVWQFAPFVLLAFSLASVAWSTATVGRRALRVLQASMMLLVAGGVVGMWLHYKGNLEFEREVSPSLGGLDLLWKAIHGASPPSLAPAALIHLGLLGLASTYLHPTLKEGTDEARHR